MTLEEYIRDTTLEHVEYVAAHMREADVEECAAGGLSPLSALRLSLDNSIVAYTLVGRDGQPGAILGVGHTDSPLWGNAWLLGTPSIVTHRQDFVLHSRPMMNKVFEDSGVEALYAYTYVGNTVHHQWLRWVGFKFIRKIRNEVYNTEFYEVVRLRG